MRVISHARMVVAIAAAGVVVLAGCAGTNPGGNGGSGHPSGSTAAHTPSPGARERFSRPVDVGNALFPLRPGTEFDYQGKVVAGGESAPHTNVFIVTDLTKVVDGVRTVVVWDRDLSGGQLQEQELAFFAQDDQGNVWNFGEYPEEYDASGKLTGAPSTWIRGSDGAYGGIHMLASPAVGVQYNEGLVPRIEFNDMSKIVGIGEKTCVPAGCYQGVLRVNEWSPDDPAGGTQVKYYAPGAGLVRVGASGGDSQEFLELTAIRHLSPPDLAAVRSAVLAIDQRGYHVSKVYRVTKPAIPG